MCWFTVDNSTKANAGLHPKNCEACEQTMLAVIPVNGNMDISVPLYPLNLLPSLSQHKTDWQKIKCEWKFRMISESFINVQCITFP